MTGYRGKCDQYDFDKIIIEKILPLIQLEKEKFVINKKNE
jgi:hypothetical protein